MPSHEHPATMTSKASLDLATSEARAEQTRRGTQVLPTRGTPWDQGQGFHTTGGPGGDSPRVALLWGGEMQSRSYTHRRPGGSP